MKSLGCYVIRSLGMRQHTTDAEFTEGFILNYILIKKKKINQFACKHMEILINMSRT